MTTVGDTDGKSPTRYGLIGVPTKSPAPGTVPNERDFAEYTTTPSDVTGTTDGFPDSEETTSAAGGQQETTDEDEEPRTTDEPDMTTTDEQNTPRMTDEQDMTTTDEDDAPRTTESGQETTTIKRFIVQQMPTTTRMCAMHFVNV